MSGFSESTMRERLQKLSNTAHSIQTLSMWILHHQKKNADAILDTWLKVYKNYQLYYCSLYYQINSRPICIIFDFKEVRSNSDNERLINLVYLANDVIQNARKKAPSFMIAFFEILQPAVKLFLYNKIH
jgi:regulator of Ty1 transposition protein 103